MAEWILQNQILSGTGVVLLGALGWLIRKFLITDRPVSPSSGVQITNHNIVHNNAGAAPAPASADVHMKSCRENVRILFVDDDTNFKVVKIMKGAGWPNVKITKDIRDLSSPDVVDASILFVDIQGVGKSLGFTDEGLGLSLAIKQKYPEKKVVIYSAQTDGDRFHRALNKADGSLSKNADPYQFISLVEELLGK